MRSEDLLGLNLDNFGLVFGERTGERFLVSEFWCLVVLSIIYLFIIALILCISLDNGYQNILTILSYRLIIKIIYKENRMEQT